MEHLVAARKGLLVILAKARGSLLKVAGGTDDSTSWKTGVSEDADMTAMAEKLNILEKAFIDAAQRRLDG